MPHCSDVRQYVDDRPEDGVFRVHQDVFSDPDVFELELRYIFERTWVFLGHESQLPKPFDYLATHIATVPVLVTRDAKGAFAGFINACRHKGALLTRRETGNRKYHVCPYHGWAYGANGKCVDVRDRQSACYAKAFDDEDHGLVPLAKFGNYRGLLFGSLSPDVPPLDEFLGDLRFFIDLAMDQGENGMEFIPGRIVSIYEGNWKLQMDNGVDAYHLTSTHSGFMDVMARRRHGEGNVEAKQFDWQQRLAQNGGNFQFANGHVATWLNQGEVAKRPIYPSIDRIRERVGAQRAEWMLKGRNTSIFPNMQLADMTSLLVRTARPLAVDRTELRYWCLAPVGEAPAERAWRLRQFEDFFNVTGLATPDDTVLYEDAQAGYSSRRVGWLQGYMRGMGNLQPGPDDVASTLGIQPVLSMRGRYDVQAETPFHPLYREWARLMDAGMRGRTGYE
jgi:benzoate/toluate 1,2-dioxygenase subunit alpha